MRYEIFPINEHKSYGITIGSRVKPDSQIKDQIKNEIDRAMERFERNSSQGHGLAVIHDLERAESGSAELPALDSWKQYLIFALLYSDPNNRDSEPPLSKQELEEYQRQIEEMLGEVLGKTVVSLVLLQDCTVRIIETDRDTNSAPSEVIENPFYETDWDGMPNRKFVAGKGSK